MTMARVYSETMTVDALRTSTWTGLVSVSDLLLLLTEFGQGC